MSIAVVEVEHRGCAESLLAWATELLPNPYITKQAYALFATPIDHCGIAWGERGLTGMQLPEQNEATTRARGRRFPQCREGLARFRMPKAICTVVAVPTALKAPSML